MTEVSIKIRQMLSKKLTGLYTCTHDHTFNIFKYCTLEVSDN